MKILVTAIGSLSAETVISSLKGEGHFIIGCDIYPSEWLITSQIVHKFYSIPKANDLKYVPELIKIIKENQVDLLLPLTDPEVDILSQYRSSFEKFKTILCLPSSEAVENSRNKSNFSAVFNNLNTIPILNWGEIEGKKMNSKIIAKPKRGRSSEGIFYIEKGEIAKSSKSDLSNYIFQTMIDGSIFTVDIVRDYFGNIVSVPRKELLRTVNGAGITVELASNKDLCILSKKVAVKLNLIGCINIEFIYDGKNYYLIDINPRFSAGIGFTVLAGYDMVKNHIKSHLRQKIDDPIDIKTQKLAKRYSDFFLD